MLAGTVVAAGVLAVQAQQAFPSGGRKIEFSDPGVSVMTSNLNALTKGKSGFPSLGDDLKLSAELFQSGSSLQGIGPMLHRTPAPAINSKKLKELLEKRQDWQFLELEDYHAEQTIEGMLGLPEYGANGELKEKKTPLERYYERFDRGNTVSTNRAQEDEEFTAESGYGKRMFGSLEEPSLLRKENRLGGNGETDDPLKHMLRGISGNPLFAEQTKRAAFTDIFGHPETGKADAAESARAQAAHLEEYKRIWDAQTQTALPSSSISGIAPFDPFKPLSSTSPAFTLPRTPEPTPVAPVTSFGPGRDVLSPLPAAGGIAAQPFDFPQATAKNPALAPSAPVPDPTRTVAPAADFSIPKRRFN
jgi:hypothetical protein